MRVQFGNKIVETNYVCNPGGQDRFIDVSTHIGHYVIDCEEPNYANMNSYQVNFYHLDDDKEEKKVCWFFCEAFGEFIKFIHFCKEYEVEFYIREDDES